MAVFYETQEGDIYGGPTKEAVIAAIQEDWADTDVSQIKELSGDMKIAVTDEDEEPTGEFITLAEEFGNGTEARHIGSSDC